MPKQGTKRLYIEDVHEAEMLDLALERLEKELANDFVTETQEQRWTFIRDELKRAKKLHDKVMQVISDFDSDKKLASAWAEESREFGMTK